MYEDESIRVLKSSKGFESKYGHYDITITPEILNQLQEGNILHLDVDEYSVALRLGDKVKYESSAFGYEDDEKMDILTDYSFKLMELGLEYSELGDELFDLASKLLTGYFGVIKDNLDLLDKVKKVVKDDKEVLEMVDYILDLGKEFQ